MVKVTYKYKGVMNSKIKIALGIAVVAVATGVGYSFLNDRKAISCAIEDTTYDIGSDGNEKLDAYRTLKSRSDFVIDYTIWKGAKVIEIWWGGVIKIQKEGVVGVITNDEIKFQPKETNCQGDGLTLNRKTLLIKGETRCDYLVGGTTKTYTRGECKRIKAPPIKEEINQI